MRGMSSLAETLRGADLSKVDVTNKQVQGIDWNCDICWLTCLNLSMGVFSYCVPALVFRI